MSPNFRLADIETLFWSYKPNIQTINSLKIDIRQIFTVLDGNYTSKNSHVSMVIETGQTLI